MSSLVDISERMTEATYFVALPRPEAIPIPAIADAFAKLIDRDTKLKRAIAERGHAERALLDARSEDEMRMTALFDAGEGEDADPREATAVAEEALKKAVARIAPSAKAAMIAYRELRETIAGHRKAWQRIARKQAEAARDRLGIALKSVELQRVEIEQAFGALELLHSDTLPPHVTLQVSAGAVETDLAIEHLSTAVVVVDRRVRVL